MIEWDELASSKAVTSSATTPKEAMMSTTVEACTTCDVERIQQALPLPLLLSSTNYRYKAHLENHYSTLNKVLKEPQGSTESTPFTLLSRRRFFCLDLLTAVSPFLRLVCQSKWIDNSANVAMRAYLFDGRIRPAKTQREYSGVSASACRSDIVGKPFMACRLRCVFQSD